MITAIAAMRSRVLRVLSIVSMYRLILFALLALFAIALVASPAGGIGAAPLALLASAAVLAVAALAVDTVAHRLLGRAPRIESSLITALILLFVLRPTLDPVELALLAGAAAVASASKYVIAWRGRHILNPAAVGAAVLTISGLGASAWWVGTPVLFVPVLLLGLAVVWRAEKLRIAALFLGVAIVVAIVRSIVQLSAAGLAIDAGQVIGFVLLQSPLLFLGLFMVTEPLTLPPRRWQQTLVAVLVGVLAGWPIDVGAFTLGQERALLIGNLVAFAFAVRGSVRLQLHGSRMITPTVRELTFRAARAVRFVPGQYVELDVPHRRPDARGTRREFSIVSAPSDAPLVRIAFRETPASRPSSFKQALARVDTGESVAITGIWGDFVLPRDPRAPLLLVAAGIGVTPFISQLREAVATGADRDVVLVYVASSAAELAYREDLAASGVRVIVHTPDEPSGLPDTWTWANGARLDAASLAASVPDIATRHAYVSGPPRLIADLAPALAGARGLTTDAFAGY